MLTSSSRRVRPYIDDDDSDDVFLPYKSAFGKRPRGKYCGWTAFLRRDSQRVMIISAPILDPDQIFVRNGMRDLTNRSRSDGTWQNRSAVLPALQMKQRIHSDTLSYNVDRRQEDVLLYHNTPDLLMHSSKDMSNTVNSQNSGVVMNDRDHGKGSVSGERKEHRPKSNHTQSESIDTNNSDVLPTCRRESNRATSGNKSMILSGSNHVSSNHTEKNSLQAGRQITGRSNDQNAHRLNIPIQAKDRDLPDEERKNDKYFQWLKMPKQTNNSDEQRRRDNKYTERHNMQRNDNVGIYTEKCEETYIERPRMTIQRNKNDLLFQKRHKDEKTIQRSYKPLQGNDKDLLYKRKQDEKHLERLNLQVQPTDKGYSEQINETAMPQMEDRGWKLEDTHYKRVSYTSTIFVLPFSYWLFW